MRVVGVTRLLNEADIVEPFVRHHAALLDLQILLDGGSTDETVSILRALHAEGLNIQVYQSSSPIFLEQAYNTGLYRLALGEGADWVFFLDADELLVTRAAARAQPILELVPADIACLRLPVFRYAVPPGEGHPLERLTHRDPEPHMPKVVVRRLDPARVAVYAGNHFAFVDGRQELGLSQDRLALAHLPERSKLQAARKAILARLKVLASGEAQAAHFNTHALDAFERLKADPRGWLAQEAKSAGAPVVEDPVPYRGGPLRYTKPADDLARLLALFAAQGELLARSHGSVLDRKRLIRRQLQEEGRVASRLF
ncbi:MAG: glycosyltransferase family 2 protein [Geminicoccaceae bacterium]